MSIYHEKQVGSYCRLHAINNLIGKKLVSTSEFDKLCDNYDKIKKYIKGTSKNRHYFINNGGTDNIFGFVLENKGYKPYMVHYNFYKQKRLNDSDVTFGCIVYNRSHTICVKRIDGILYKIDSMGRRPMKTSMRHFGRKGFGIINVTFL